MVGKGTSRLLRALGLVVVLGVSMACVSLPGSSEPLEEEPEYALAPPGADEVGSGTATPFMAGDGGILRVLAVPASDDDVVAYYRRQLADYGWEPEEGLSPGAEPERAVLGWAKGDLHFRLALWEGLEDDPRTIVAITIYREDG